MRELLEGQGLAMSDAREEATKDLLGQIDPRLKAAEAECERLREGLRWIAAGKTGSCGTPQAFASAILSEEA